MKCLRADHAHVEFSCSQLLTVIKGPIYLIVLSAHSIRQVATKHTAAADLEDLHQHLV